LDEVKDFVRGFVLGHIVEAEPTPHVIRLARSFLDHESGERRQQISRAIDAAEKGWKEQQSQQAKAGEEKPTTDGRASGLFRRPVIGGGTAMTGGQYAEKLREGRARMKDGGASPAQVQTAADYAQSLRAGRARMRGA
jgi:hypothetical protein